VIATRPATAPRPHRASSACRVDHSAKDQASAAAAVARIVLANTMLVKPFASRPSHVEAEPATHSSDAPIITIGTLCGGMRSCRSRCACDHQRADESAMPALMCTTVPREVERAFLEQEAAVSAAAAAPLHPCSVRTAHHQTMCAIGSRQR